MLGPVWVFLGVGEAPSIWTLLGGPLLLAILAAHEVAAHVAARRPPTIVAKLRAPPTAGGGAADGGTDDSPSVVDTLDSTSTSRASGVTSAPASVQPPAHLEEVALSQADCRV